MSYQNDPVGIANALQRSIANLLNDILNIICYRRDDLIIHFSVGYIPILSDGGVI